MDDGLIAGMAIVGVKFRENFIFVPEVLACARAMKAGMAHIEPILSEAGIEPLGKVVMGTVKGDLHDIGKNLCIMMLRGSGFEVVDLGVDTSADDFIDAVEEHKPSIVGMSALLTTTMPNMGRTIDAFIDADLRDVVKIMVGGAPVTQEFADDMGADGYGKDAMACVALAKQLIGVESRALRRSTGSVYQERLDRIGEIFSSMMITVEDLTGAAARTRTASTSARRSSDAATSGSPRIRRN